MNNACERVVSLFGDLKFYLGLLNEGLQNQSDFKIPETREIKTEMIRVLKEVEERTEGADKVFLRELEKEETWEKLEAVLAARAEHISRAERAGTTWVPLKIPRELYDEVGEIFGSLEPKRFTTKSYQRFAQALTQGKIERRINILSSKFDAGLTHGAYYFSKLANIINSIFLNRNMPDDYFLDLNSLPDTVSRKLFVKFFGCFLEKGTIRLKSAGDCVGYKAKRGIIIADVVRDFAGAGAGTRFSLVAKKAGHNLGLGCSATISVNEAESADQPLGALYAHRINVDSKATAALVTDTLPRATWTSLAHAYRYNDRDYNYYNLGGGAPSVPVKSISTIEELRSLWPKEKFALITDLRLFTNNPTENFDDKILVLRQAPEEIGKNMTSGIIIIEDYSLKAAEIRRRISPSKKGGLIMMRIRDALSLETRLELVG